MNLKKAALLIALCVAAFPSVGNTKAVQDNQNVYCAKRKTIGGFFIHLITLRHKD